MNSLYNPDQGSLVSRSLREVVEGWFASERSRKGVNRTMFILVAIFVACILTRVIFGPSDWLVLPSLLSMSIASGYFGWHWQIDRKAFAPDALLLELANHSEVPMSVKKAIATEIADHGRVTIGFLYDLSAARGRNHTCPALGEGHQQMLKVAEVDRVIGEA